YRFTLPIKIIHIAVRQYALYALIYISYFGFSQTILEIPKVICFLTVLFWSLLLVKFIMYWALKKYRLKGGNGRKTVILGNNQATRALETFFLKKPIYGYNYLGYFTNKEVYTEANEKLGSFEDSFKYIKERDIDDIYCSISEFTEVEIEKLIRYSNTHFKTLKFIPDSNQILSSGFEVDYYDYFPVLTMSELALNKSSYRFIKRAFDIVFSVLVIIGLLSWLIPLLYVLTKFESKGSLFYIQVRNGLDYKKFQCYKFRTLRIGKSDDNHVSVDDSRVTKLGSFLRKTSIDELPQFINVLRGDMSVVGPRPHMLAYNKAYANQVDNIQLMARHRIVPGITGLAQVRGFRGAIEKDADIIGRVKLDLFYIKNWSVLLDMKIILMTLVKLILGDEKAY
ncbi:MAG: exopolysaccharide biosynthesis polyprenyl glycosylphosphotransferase, partial [Flavobacteriaceae bacterium]|nr:exopolysaccharide biosynthesis polyprenyl glycosylphosphotransferase [Flavobacteriaceae bacterium]